MLKTSNEWLPIVPQSEGQSPYKPASLLFLPHPYQAHSFLWPLRGVFPLSDRLFPHMSTGPPLPTVVVTVGGSDLLWCHGDYLWFRAARQILLWKHTGLLV